MSLETRWKKLIEGEKGLVAAGLRSLLLACSIPYRIVSSCRNFAYEQKWLRTTRPQGPLLISIGNLVTGGTGKTPFVQLLANELQHQSSLAVVARGYRSAAQNGANPMLVSAKIGPLPSAALCGDEVRLLAERLPKTLFFVSRDKRGAARAASDAGAKIILIDDGLQHRKLARDLDVVLIDGTAPFSNGHLFPRGALRESPKSLGRAHLLVINSIRDTEHFTRICALLRAYSNAPAIGVRSTVTEVLSQNGEKIESLRGCRVGIFCGIAHPERFQDTVTELGATVVSALYSSDHCLPEKESLVAFAKGCAAKGAKWILCTEKDRAKLEKSLTLALPIACVCISLEVVEGLQHWHAFTSNLCIERGKPAIPAGM